MTVRPHRAKKTAMYLPTPPWPPASCPWPSCGSWPWSSWSCLVSMRFLEQVQERKQENPDQIDEVPVQADVLDDVSSPPAQIHRQDKGKGNQPDQHVDGMKAGHQEVSAGPHVAAGDLHRQ